MLRVGSLPISMIRSPGLDVIARFDPTGKADGTYAFDTGHAAGFVMSGGYFSWTPTLGAELVTDPGLEANYTAGKCDTLTGGANITKAQSADVHGGSKAQEGTPTAANAGMYWPATVSVGAWLQVSEWGKRTAGANGLTGMGYNDGVSDGPISAITSAAYAQIAQTFRAIGTGARLYAIAQPGSAGGDTVIVDDGSIKAITLSTTPQLIDSGTPSHTINAKIHALPADLQGGVTVLATADMTSNVKVYLDGTSLIVTKRVSGTVTVLQTIAQALVVDAELKVGCVRVPTGVEVSVAYNGALLYVGTVTDAELIGNTRCGPWLTDPTVTFAGMLTVSVLPVKTTIISGPAQAPTLAYGAELIVNGNMETADPPSSWVAGSSATLSAAADERTGGAGSKSLSVVNGAATTGFVRQPTVTVTNTWYVVRAYLRKVTSNVTLRMQDFSVGVAVESAAYSSTDWGLVTVVGRANGTVCGPVILNSSSTLGHESRADDVTQLPITLSSTLSGGGDAGARYGIYDAACTVTANYHAGIVACLDSAATPANYLHGYVDQGTGKAYLLKVVGGTTTELIAATVTYGAANVLRIVVVPGSSGISNAQVSLLYNGTQVGTVQTVDLSSGFGTLAKTFRTNNADTVLLEAYVV